MAKKRRAPSPLWSALHLAELRYRGGLSNYLGVLTAKRNVFDVDLSLTATRRLRLVSMIQLYKALRGGWSPSDAVQRSGDPSLIAAPAGRSAAGG
jgi:multidrug efflux system outer membrane protein